MLHHAGDSRAQADDLRRLLRRTGAVAKFMRVVEQPLDRVAIRRLEDIERNIDCDRMFLSDVTHVDGAPNIDVMRGLARFRDRGAAFALQFGKDRVDLVERCSCRAASDACGQNRSADRKTACRTTKTRRPPAG